MRRSLFVGCLALAAGAAVACATTGEDATPPERDSGTSVPPAVDGGAADVDAGGSRDGDIVEPPSCSAAGWCITTLPDSDLLMKDISVLPGRAFAMAESPTLGVKVLEWVEADAKWAYVDDGTQNEDGRGTWAGTIWAPSENEIYFGVSPNHIFHGTRTAPGSAFSWEHGPIGINNAADPNDGNLSYWKRGGQRIPSLGVWGTSSNDVYAWFKGTIYHRTSVDGGAWEWVPEYVAEDRDVATEQLAFFGATGTGPDNVLFSGARSRLVSACPIVVRKSAGTYERIADGIAGSINQACKPRPNALLIGGEEGWLTDLQAVSGDEIVGLKGSRNVAKISIDAGAYSVAFATIPSTVSSNPLNSLSTTGGDLWLGGAGLVVRGGAVWEGGAFELSTLSLNGAPLNRAIYQVRGTSNTNLWAIGVRNALHKTTP